MCNICSKPAEYRKRYYQHTDYACAQHAKQVLGNHYERIEK